MKYKLAFQYATYREYCADRAAHGLQVIPAIGVTMFKEPYWGSRWSFGCHQKAQFHQSGASYQRKAFHIAPPKFVFNGCFTVADRIDNNRYSFAKSFQ